MKKVLLFLFLSMGLCTYAQELPTIPASGFSFTIGTKFTIKLYAVDSVNYNYSVIAFEEFKQTVDTWHHDDLFDYKGKDSTITFYFCYGTHGDSEKEKEKNMQFLLIFKSELKVPLKYISEIQRKENDEYKSTSNIGIYPGAKGMEMWPYAIYAIGLRDFKKYK